MTRPARSVVAMLLLVLCLAPADARADVFLTPFAGITFGGDAENSEFTAGASLTWMGAGVAGVEFDFGYTPDFFSQQPDFALLADSNVTTAMVSLIVGAPVGGTRGPGIRPYVAGGLGIIRTNFDFDLIDDISSNDLGLNAGAGVLIFANDHIGFRGDVRYFRRLQDPEADDDLDLVVGTFDFWRATAGLNIRF